MALTKWEQAIYKLVREYSGATKADTEGEDLPALVDECMGELARQAEPMATIGPAAFKAGWNGTVPIAEFVCARLAATADAPVVEPVALTGFTVQEVIDACDAAGIDDREFRRLMSALKVKAADTQATTEFDVEMDQALSERDEREEVINAILDEVLGLDRHEWSSAYGFADAIEDVKTRMWALTRPPVPEEAKDAARLDALSRPGWELGVSDDPEVDPERLWQVHRRSGGWNDREWTLIGEGATPREAIDAAVRASRPDLKAAAKK